MGAAMTDKTEDETFQIKTTAPGTFGSEGIAKVGSTREVTLGQYSENWMVPANGAAQIKLKKLREAKEKTASAKSS